MSKCYRGLISVVMYCLCVALILLFYSSYVSAGVLDLAARGYVEPSVYPPHNEYDPNSGVSEQFVPYGVRTVARYAFELDLEVWWKDLPWLFFFTKDKAYFGGTRSHVDYNYRADPIVMDAQWGGGIKVFGVEWRATHGQSVSLGNKFIAEPQLWNSFSVRVPFEFN